jgi:hypothetical protein
MVAARADDGRLSEHDLADVEELCRDLGQERLTDEERKAVERVARRRELSVTLAP